MPGPAIESRLTGLLAEMNARGGYPLSLVCTDQGLLLASAGESLRSEITAGITSLFDHIVARAARDLGLRGVDELTLSDAHAGRTVIRPLTHPGGQVRLFLVVQVPRGGSWRRNTNLVVRELLAVLRPLLSPKETP
jgi:hypothetical protein